VRAFLIGCAFLLLVVGCAGTTSSETSNKKEQGRSLQATESEVEARCEGTRTYHRYQVLHGPGYWNGTQRTGSEEEMRKADKKARHNGNKVRDLGLETTNELPGCPNKGGLLLGTDKTDLLDGKHGDDEVRSLGGRDGITGGPGNDILYGGDGVDGISGGKGDDVIHAGDGNEDFLSGGQGEDVIYGGDGNDTLDGEDGQRDKLYCGKGNHDGYLADKNDYVDSSCEKKRTSNYFYA
jgi:hypothetical protein